MSVKCTTRLALVQMSCSSDKSANLEKAIECIVAAAKQGAQIVCLQEVFNTKYPCQQEDHAIFDLAEEIPGPSSNAMQRVAKQLGIVLTGSAFRTARTWPVSQHGSDV